MSARGGGAGPRSQFDTGSGAGAAKVAVAQSIARSLSDSIDLRDRFC